MDRMVSQVLEVFQPGEELNMIDIMGRMDETFGSELDLVRAVYCAHIRGHIVGRPTGGIIQFNYRVDGPALPGAHYWLADGPQTYLERHQSLIDQTDAISADIGRMRLHALRCKDRKSERELIRRIDATREYIQVLKVDGQAQRKENRLLLQEGAVLKFHAGREI